MKTKTDPGNRIIYFYVMEMKIQIEGETKH